jgi:hypothetical protein
MSETPNFGFNPNPEFSVNHISEYLATENAPQRTKIIRAAKFPKKIEVAAYAQIRKALQAALSKPEFDRAGMAFLADKMAAKARMETGYARDEALRCERAIRAFIRSMDPRSFSKFTISPSPSPLLVKNADVRLKVTIDASVTATSKETANSGGIVLLYAFSADREGIKDRLKSITGMTLWALEGKQMEPLPRLCMAVDLAAGDVARASESHTRFRQHVTDSCHEIAARWNAIEPPPDYDGPAWR